MFWSESIAKLCKDLEQQVILLHVSLNAYFEARQAGLNDPTTQFGKVIFGIGEKDEYKQAVEKAVGQLENFLRKHIGSD